MIWANIMTSEDWKTVLLAAIAALSTFGGAVVVAYGEILRRKANSNATKAETAAVAADDARVTAENAAVEMRNTQGLINGRLDAWMAQKEAEAKAREEIAFARGHIEGMKTLAKSMVDNPKVPVDAQTVAQVVAAASQPPPS